MGGEIDIMEMNGGVYGNTVVGTYSWSKNCSAGEPHPQPAPANCTCGCGCDLFFGKGATGAYRKTQKTTDTAFQCHRRGCSCNRKLTFRAISISLRVRLRCINRRQRCERPLQLHRDLSLDVQRDA